MNDIESIRAVLLDSMDKQLAADIAANEETQKLGEQKIMYGNDARGTLYSGQPTWERAQNAVTSLNNLAKIQETDLNQRYNIWSKVANTLDQINSYNQAARQLSSGTTTGNSTTAQTYLDYYNSLLGGE